MKKAALGIIVLMALPLAALRAQSDPAYAPPADQAAVDPSAAPANPADPAPAPVDPPATASPSNDLGATDPDAVNDPDDAGTLPATASHGPLILLMGILAIGMFLVLKVFRRRSLDVS
jgi:LPXTG-motif cell wall-anchored protein